MVVYLAKIFASRFAKLLATDIIVNYQKYRSSNEFMYEYLTSEKYKLRINTWIHMKEEKTSFEPGFWSKVLLKFAVKKWRNNIFKFNQ